MDSNSTDNYLMKTILVVMFTLSLLGCAKSADTSATPSKALLSKWSTTGGATFDFSTFALNQPKALAFTVNELSAKCSCFFELQGTDTNGNLVINQCIYKDGGTGDPGTCPSYDATFSYQRAGTVLKFCNYLDSTDCTEFF